MPPMLSCLDAHKCEANKFAARLQQARDFAFQKRAYQSAPTCTKLHLEFSAHNAGMQAYPWQVDVAEALLLGLDCTVIAGTGAGKTMPFVMPLFIETKKIIIIISPLNALEEDQVMNHPLILKHELIVLQASRFKKMGFSAVAINGETYCNDIHKVCL